MKYDFDTIIDRTNTSSYKWDQSEKLFGEKDIIPMWVADMDFKSPMEVVEAITKRAEQGIYGYTIKPQSYYDAIIGWLKRRHQWEVKQEWLSSSPGVVPALSMIVSTFTEPEDKVIIQSPVYYPFFDVISTNGRTLVDNPLKLDQGRYTMDLEDLEGKMQDEKVKLLLLCSPHNPGGRVWSKDELTKLGELCIKHNVIVISDEIHGDLVFKGSRHIPFASISEEFAQCSITCIAPSKTFNLAGLQTSTIIIPNPKLRKTYNDILKSLSLHLENYFGVTAIEAAYNHGGEWLDQLMEYLQGNLEFLTAFVENQLHPVKVIKPEGTYLIWLDCRELGMDASSIKSFMFNKAKVAFSEGSVFGANGEGFLRINIACPRSILEEGLERFKQALHENKYLSRA